MVASNDVAELPMDPVPVVQYDDSDFCFRLTDSYTESSNFDEKLIRGWKHACANGVMNFAPPPGSSWRKLEEKYGFFVILNPGRRNKRRTPVVFKTTKDPIDNSAFNFTQVGREQILLELAMKNEARASVLVNVSPFAETSSLLVPRCSSLLPQILNVDGLETAVHVLLLSRHRNLRVVFNSMCAYASVNHYHFHLFYDEHPMYLESAPLQVLESPCYVLKEYPAPAFAFCFSDDDVSGFVRTVIRLTDWLLSKDIPHNVTLVRGTDPCSPEQCCSSIVRCYVWARAPSTGLKVGAPFFPAVLELSGRVLTFDDHVAASISEDDISMKLSEACVETHRRISADVCELFAWVR